MRTLMQKSIYIFGYWYKRTEVNTTIGILKKEQNVLNI